MERYCSYCRLVVDGGEYDAAHVHVQRKVTVRLTPFQSKKLWQLRTAGLPRGARPRSATQVIVEALLLRAECAEESAPAPLREVGRLEVG